MDWGFRVGVEQRVLDRELEWAKKSQGESELEKEPEGCKVREIGTERVRVTHREPKKASERAIMSHNESEWPRMGQRSSQSGREWASVCKSKQDEPDEQEGARESSQLIMRDIEKEIGLQSVIMKGSLAQTTRQKSSQKHVIQLRSLFCLREIFRFGT